ncbi:DUF6355 family natural product biosynthesis protein [Streptomyces resistomycificus]|uniref:Secreted protein n=1 Tax=Streptomyces resistomycificus TaxID=67356 RepID=A0A0L8LWV3_9ACTN|nr:DUF6355 family natural product biosynthesis protein [Streptomyces resistomycificus]KOG42565.1 hypothetical protein ADK37_05510 [Streptomyces resistomycificus]KUN92718.1 hypothetical protein AQJ84_32610 [Streptomyces resistomycificus]
MRIRRTVTNALGAAALVFASLGAVTTTASPAAADPCGFYETGSDAFYNHCTSDGSRVVIKVEVAWQADYERCVAPGKSWLGAASKIEGAYYLGRTC